MRLVVGIGLGGALEVVDRRRRVAGAEIEERDPLERAGAHRIEPERVGPGVERAGEVALVAEDPRHQIVRVGEAGIPAEPAAGHLARRLELAPAAERLGQLEEREAGRLLGQRAP